MDFSKRIKNKKEWVEEKVLLEKITSLEKENDTDNKNFEELDIARN